MKKITSAVVLTLFVGMILSQDVLLARQQGNKYSLVVLNLAPSGSAVTANDARLLSATLTEEISKTGLFYTMTHDNMEKGLLAKNIDPANCGDARCGVQAARALGVQVVVVGAITGGVEGYVVEAHMIHVTSREVVRSAREEFAGEVSGLMTHMSSLARKLVGRSNGYTQSTPAPSPSRVPESDYGRSYYDDGGGFKWQYFGLGLLIAGGVGAGIYFAANGSDGGNGGTVTPPPDTKLPGPPVFP